MGKRVVDHRVSIRDRLGVKKRAMLVVEELRACILGLLEGRGLSLRVFVRSRLEETCYLLLSIVGVLDCYQ